MGSTEDQKEINEKYAPSLVYIEMPKAGEKTQWQMRLADGEVISCEASFRKIKFDERPFTVLAVKRQNVKTPYQYEVDYYAKDQGLLNTMWVERNEWFELLRRDNAEVDFPPTLAPKAKPSSKTSVRVSPHKQ